MEVHSYKDLIVWQRSVELVLEIYKITEQFLKEEIYGLTSQMRRAAISIPSNIAEGRFRGTRKDFAQFLRIARASGAELETQMIIAQKLPHIGTLQYDRAAQLFGEVMKMLTSMLNKLKS